MYFSSEVVGDTERLIELGERSRSKDLASDYEIARGEKELEAEHDVGIEL